ncbi:MAG: serine hydrolase [Burkholderiales bacterium]|nr:serine hydrolase [Burkholderiales bacterium]
MRWLASMMVALALASGDVGLSLQQAQAKAQQVKKPAAQKSSPKTTGAKAPKRAQPRKAKAVPRASVRARSAVKSRSFAPARPSFGQLYGLQQTDDPLDLKSSVALVMDQDTEEVLLAKNDNAVLPIASITKLMTALVVSEAHQPMDELITITQDDVDTEKGTRSRLKVGTQLTRGELMHLALMSSENRAAHALGRAYPGGLKAAVQAMNAKAQLLGMTGTSYVEPTGLSPANQSSAHDLARLVKTAYDVPLIRDLSTSTGATVRVGRRDAQFGTTNGLVKNPIWDIGLQKTGYISEAGQCLVMQAQLAGRRLVMVFLDSAGKYSRIGDAERVRRWLQGAGNADQRATL